MRRYELSEAKERLSELVERASRGERIGITVHGKLVAKIIPPPEAMDLKEAFEEIEPIRKRKTPPGYDSQGLD